MLTSREDFNQIMDDFLENYEILGGKMRPVLEGQTGADKLATFRRALRDDEERAVVTPHDSNDDDSDLLVRVSDEEDKHERWDCETILSACYHNWQACLHTPYIFTLTLKRFSYLLQP